MSQVGASSGFGAMTARALADAGHTVYASMRDTGNGKAPAVEAVNTYAKEHGVDLRAIQLNVLSQESADAAVAQVVAEQGCIDVVMHNAGHMVFGAAEAFTLEQYAQLYDVNVLGTQRVNRAALPQLRKQGKGLLLWVGSSSHRGGTPPYLAPYFAAKAAMDALAVSYAGELARRDIESSIVVPGAFTQGTNHFVHTGKPADEARQSEYDNGANRGLAEEALKNLTACEPPDAEEIEEVTSASGAHVPLSFEARSHDDILAIVERVRAGTAFTSDDEIALALGIKLFTSVMLIHRKDPLFADIQPAMRAFIGNLKSRVASTTSRSS